jgi:uncharacterized protein (DUF433 family)
MMWIGAPPVSGKEGLTSLVLAAVPAPLVADTDGVVRIRGTRVTLDTLIAAFHEGTTAKGVVDQYPSLSLADVYTALGYYLRHHAEADAYLQRRREHAAQVRQENEARFPPAGVRDRLLARLAANDRLP